MDEKEKEIKEGDFVLADGFRGKVIRFRKLNGETLVDIEIGGVINPYQMKDIKPE
ncbi:hypothetical protein [Sulfuricurvum sp.]|uniref:hypothetical protein n=1 Tax=Sulfuricurvum sp. TaxID=2025608 RepID=UPI0026316AC7|nr:hypothetical protein [Sulfuricurvum sp.]MDD2267040.1 hypothetical protein [Sulfuricurvum sp.]MDD2785067.1 hypothetical protein [Sulfuricurvum sp.]